MASAPTSQPADPPSSAVQVFAARHYEASGAARLGIDIAGLAALLAEAIGQRDPAAREDDVEEMLASLKLEELVLTRACIAGNDRAWEIFLTRYRGTLYEVAYKVAHDETAARALADSLYAGLYGVNERGEARKSKLQYYLGRGSLAGWLRTVVAQEYINQYRRTRRESSLEAAIEDGKQFAIAEPEVSPADSRLEAATAKELATLSAEERFLLAAYYLDRRTLAEIGRVLGVHESTLSRKLDRVTAALRKNIRRRLLELGMSARQADEVMQDMDVRDLNVKVRESLGQDGGTLSFYKEKEG